LELNGQRLKELREAAFMGVEDLAKKIGVSHSQVSRWESGKTKPRHYHLKKLVKIFGEQLVAEETV
jgi:predicted transcriptional regulator